MKTRNSIVHSMIFVSICIECIVSSGDFGPPIDIVVSCRANETQFEGIGEKAGPMWVGGGPEGPG